MKIKLRVHEAVLKLAPQYRLVLVLHDMEELDTEEVAAVLSLQPGTCVCGCIGRA